MAMSVHGLLQLGERGRRSRALDASHLPMLYVYRAIAEQLAHPAGDAAIVAHLTRLRSHYPPTAGVTDQVASARWEDWLEDFADVAADQLAEACRAWRNSPERWPPTPGQLKALIRGGIDSRLWLAQLAREAIAELEASAEL
jgi:hypothetical protein